MEMTPRENMMAILEGRQPEYYGDFQWAVKLMMDPVWKSDSMPKDGLEHKDSWGTVCVNPVGGAGKHPVITPENAVVTDIEKWREQLVIPSLDDKDWSDAAAKAAAVKIQGVERNRLTSGACVKMRGGVSDVRAAMEAALETAKEMDSEVYSHTIIASPSEDSELAIRMTINK